MPTILADLEFLAKLDIYKDIKPYTILLGEDEVLDDDLPASNLEFQKASQIVVQDMRDMHELDFDQCGFKYIPHHQSRISTFEAYEDVVEYQKETENLLTGLFNAVLVVTYETKLRQNIRFDRQSYDINDSLVPEGPATGAHVDVTPCSALEIIRKSLSAKQQSQYLQQGYRLRIINTWRPLNPVVEDRPLALCDSRTVMEEDLAPADRVLPDKVGEIYYLHHAPSQKWYWLEKQKCTEPFIILMYDTMSSDTTARRCPHVSFHNTRAPSDAQFRSSVETRSIVISTTASDQRSDQMVSIVG